MTPDVNARQNASLRFARSFAVVCTVIVAVTILLAELVLPASSLFANQPVRLIWAAPAVGGLLLPAAFSLTAGVHAHAQKRPPLLARRDTRIVVGYSIGMVLFGAGPLLAFTGWLAEFLRSPGCAGGVRTASQHRVLRCAPTDGPRPLPPQFGRSLCQLRVLGRRLSLPGVPRVRLVAFASRLGVGRSG
jgi:hypothetical protein